MSQKRWVGGVDPVWRKDFEDDEKFLDWRENRRIAKLETQAKVKAALDAQKSEPVTVEDISEIVGAEEPLERQDSNEMMVPIKIPKTVKQKVKPAQTRSRTEETSEQPTNQSFPNIPVRTGYKTFNMDIIEVMVVAESKFGVERRKVGGLVCYIMNRLAGQNWEEATEDTIADFETIDVTEDTDDQDSNKKRKRRETRDLTNVLPSRKAINAKLQDAALLNVQFAAESVVKTFKAGGTTTFGTDDTVKSSGYRTHDTKTGHLTLVDKVTDTEGTITKKRKVFTTGFLENISHSGADSAKAAKLWISEMAVLAGTSYDEMKSFIDFFMNDRAGDSDTMLDALDVTEERRLKCNAHPLLAVQNSIDKTFKDEEAKIGVQKLISADAAHVFSSPKNSIWYLGLLAFSKMLSPSHSQETISLFTRYKSFLKITGENHDSPLSEVAKKLLKENFLGFSSNRFGRIPELSNIFVEHKDTISQFYDEQIDENQNKLWLACFSYMNSAWFRICCEVGAFFFHEVIKPHKLALGIDEGRVEKSEFRSWTGMKEFYAQLLEKLGNIAVRRPDMSGKDLLKAKVAGNIAEAISHQLGYMKYFNKDENLSTDILEKLDSAPLTNDGCESHFAHLDQDCRRSGGQTKLETLEAHIQ